MKTLPEHLNFRIPDWMLPVFALMNPGRSTGRCPGDGVHRAAARLAAHRKRFAGIDLTPIPSRQQRRAAERAKAKAILRARRTVSAPLPGGSAACR